LLLLLDRLNNKSPLKKTLFSTFFWLCAPQLCYWGDFGASLLFLYLQ
jgi:hypothetical protein